MTRIRTIAAGATLLLMSHTVLAQDWPQWRGPSRDGRVDAFVPPSVWPATLGEIWKVTVGDGHSSPVVSGDRVYVHARQGDQEIVRGLDLATGRERWRDSYPAAYTALPEAAAHGSGPRATPVVEGRRLYTFGITGVLSCYDVDRGVVTWRVETERAFDNTPLVYGMTASPLLDRGLVIVHTGNEKRGALVAFDATTGRERWRAEGTSPSHTSPIAIEIDGTRQIIDVSYRAILGVDAGTGAVLWQIPYAPIAFPHAVTPVSYRDTVIVSASRKGLVAYRVFKTPDGWSTAEAWNNSAAAMAMSTPVLSGDRLLGLAERNSGQFIGVDARTGTTLWTSPGREGETAALLDVRGLLMLFREDGTLSVVGRPDRGVEPIARYQVSRRALWSIPAFAGPRLIIKDGDQIVLWQLPVAA
jgi:outer membrane protein assembly factor BamB